MGIIQLTPAIIMPLHGACAITLVWLLHHACLVPSQPSSRSRSQLVHSQLDVSSRLNELGIRSAGPDTCAKIDLALEERRKDVRKSGDSLPVFIYDDSGFCQGHVMNKSRGGLCIASESHVAVGQSIRIQCQLDAKSTASIDMKVCHVRQERDSWIFGCQFLKPQDPVVLQLFG